MVHHDNCQILNNGVRMPCIGLGTVNSMSGVNLSTKNGGVLGRIYNRCLYEWHRVPCSLRFVKNVEKAIEFGYRLIDTSAAYENEKLIGKAIRKSRASREELFVTTRISNRQQRQGDVRTALLGSLRNLGIDHVDLYMFHWPVPETYIDVWKQMEELYREGLAKAIGVANCHEHHLEKLLKTASVVPAVNQFEVHPLMSQKPLITYCKSKGIVVEAYTPIGRNHEKLTNSPVLRNIANAHRKTIQQVILRWHIQNGIVPIPRSSNLERLKSNVSVFDFSLDENEMEFVDGINEDLRLRFDPDDCDFSKL